MSGLNLILLGCPGSGKGTQARILSEKFGVRHIATGDILRKEIGQKTDLGKRVEQYVKSGKLVPDAVMLEMVLRALEACSDGFVLDGFPRTLEQAQSLDSFLKKNNKVIHLVLYLELTEAEVLRRLSSRRYCVQCDQVYNLATRVPKTENQCDECGGTLAQRADDRLDTVRKRLMVYRDLTEPLIAYYKANETFSSVDGSLGIEEVSKELIQVVQNKAAYANQPD